ncbi:MAG: translocation/assembly module TamB domain-containing protein, partial [Janthinobacterium lividum]
LAAPAPLLVSQQRFALERLRNRSSTALLEVSHFLREPQRIVTRGRLEHFNLGTALAAAGLGATAAGQSASNPAALPIDSDLVLDGQWNLVLANVAGGGIRGSASVRRLQGDITMRGDTPVALGLSKLEAMLEAGDGRLGLRVNADGQRLGHIDLAGSAALGNGSGSGIALAPDAAISASANIDVPSIAWAGALLSPSLTAEGSVRCAITVGGTLATPRLAGQINGAGLRLFLADLGIDLRGGMLEASFRDTELLLKRLEFTNGAGQLSVTGPIDLANGQPSARLALLASHYPLLDRPDRKLTIGGATSRCCSRARPISRAVSWSSRVSSTLAAKGRRSYPPT